MANVKLSTSELELVTDAHFILTKNRIIAKVDRLFGMLAEAYSQEIKDKGILPNEVLKISPKISKGENYEGLPWVMLDHPRYFTKEDVFAIRSFFWWGHFASITLQLKGRYVERFRVEGLGLKAESERQNAKSRKPGSGGERQDIGSEWFLCCNGTDEWQHHFGEDNYKLLSLFPLEELHRLPFIKLAKKIPLQEWDNMDIFFTAAFTEIMGMLSLTA